MKYLFRTPLEAPIAYGGLEVDMQAVNWGTFDCTQETHGVIKLAIQYVVGVYNKALKTNKNDGLVVLVLSCEGSARPQVGGEQSAHNGMY
ncbi:Protein of unknown function [Gryllus bimaculatus]|nr:Protein of unknown function [Gryllus bimaculatus]